jgi:hypothetical protein
MKEREETEVRPTPCHSGLVPPLMEVAASHIAGDSDSVTFPVVVFNC